MSLLIFRWFPLPYFFGTADIFYRSSSIFRVERAAGTIVAFPVLSLRTIAVSFDGVLSFDGRVASPLAFSTSKLRGGDRTNMCRPEKNVGLYYTSGIENIAHAINCRSNFGTPCILKQSEYCQHIFCCLHTQAENTSRRPRKPLGLAALVVTTNVMTL